MIVEQVVVHDLEAIWYNSFMSFINFYNCVHFACMIFFLVNPAVDTLIMKHEDNELLVELNYLFSRRASYMDILQFFKINIVVVIREQKFESLMNFIFMFEEI